MRRLLALIGAVALLFVGLFAGVAYATSTTTDLGSAVKFKMVEETVVSSTFGTYLSYHADCPAGYKVIGGGGFVFNSGTFRQVWASYPSEGNKWYISAQVSNGDTVTVRANCVGVS